MQLISPRPSLSRRRLRLTALLISCSVALMGAQQAAADTSSYVQSAAALNFPGDSPSHNANWFLYDTACDSGHTCEAVGYYTDGADTQQAYAEQIVDGVPGPAVKVPLPADASANPTATLLGVTCSAPGSCEAYGTYAATVHGNTVTEALAVPITDGVPAVATALPRPADAGASSISPSGIACSSASRCTVIGSYETTGGLNLPFVVPINDGAPQAVAVPNLPDAAANPGATLDGVACQATGSCVAVGAYDTASGSVPLVVAIDAGAVGNGVSVQPADAGSNSASGLSYVACPASGACVAAGDYITNANVAETLVVPIVDGLPGTATGVAAPSRHNNDAEVTVNGLACSSSSLCVAAGYYTDSSGNSQAAVIPISGPSPTAYETALPSDSATTNPYAAYYADSDNSSVVGCVTGGSCLAAGDYDTTAGSFASAGLVQEVTASGLVGSGVSAAAPADISPTGVGHGPEATPYFGTACVDSGSCITTGEYYDTANLVQPYVVSLQAPLGVTTAALTAARQGSPYQATLVGTGAWGSYSWSLASGSLPAGLSLDQQTGEISGTPTGSGSATFTVKVMGTGAPVQTATRQLSIDVAPSVTTATAAVPVLSLRTASGRLSANRLGVRLSCAAAACSGRVRIEATAIVAVGHGRKRRHRRVSVVIGSRAYTLAAGASQTLEVSLDRSGRRVLSATKRRRLRVTVVATVTGGQPVLRHETIHGAVNRRGRR